MSYIKIFLELYNFNALYQHNPITHVIIENVKIDKDKCIIQFLECINQSIAYCIAYHVVPTWSVSTVVAKTLFHCAA